MSDKRKPRLKISAEIYGNMSLEDGKRQVKKRVKVELFPAELFSKFKNTASQRGERYRVRINGKWADGGNVHTLSGVINQFRKFLRKKL